MERVRGIEPPLSAWEADVLPLNYTRGPAHRTDRPERSPSVAPAAAADGVRVSGLDESEHMFAFWSGRLYGSFIARWVASVHPQSDFLTEPMGIDVLERVVSDIKRTEVSGLTRPQLCDLTAEIGQARGALDALEVEVSVAVDSLEDNGADAESIMRNQGRCSKREAARRKRRADRLRNMPNTRKKLAEGDLTAEHADELAKAAEATSEDAVDSDESLLDGASRRPADLAGRDIRDWVDRHQREEDRSDRHSRQRARRSVTLFNGDDDMGVLHCRTDKVSFQQLKARVESVARSLYRQDGGREGRDGVEPRTWDQLRHDAFMILMGVDATTGAVSAAGAPKSDEDPMAELDRLAKPATSARNQIVVVADLAALLGDQAACVEIPGLGPIPRGVLDRLGCDAEVFGHVFGGDGISLWHGRGMRTTSPQQWRGLVARDRGCVICAAAPPYCEAHHVVPWSVHGPTDIENLVLLCTRHHHEVHDTGQLLRRRGSRWEMVPTRAGPGQPLAA